MQRSRTYFDYDDHAFIKFFPYLTDVDLDNAGCLRTSRGRTDTSRLGTTAATRTRSC